MTIETLRDKIAPTAPALAAFLGGPGSAIALANLGKTINADDQSTVDQIEAKIDAGDPAIDGQIKDAETATFQDFTGASGSIEQAKIDAGSAAKRLDTLTALEAQAASDRQNARAHQLEAKDWWINPILAVLVTLGFFGVIIYTLWLSKEKLDVTGTATTLLGVLGTSWVSIITFYFGSSVGSKTKTKLLAGQLSAPPPPSPSPPTK